MAAAKTPSARSRKAFTILLVLLALVSVLPVRWTEWLGEMRRLVLIPTGPISRVTYGMTRTIFPAEPTVPSDQIRLLEEERQGFETLYLRARTENQSLRLTIQELQRGLALNPDLPVRQVVASVLGASADLSSGILTVRVPSGASAEIDRNTVATTRGLQLVGRVTTVSGGTCSLQPITRKAAGKIQVRIIAGDEALALAANLAPQGDGTLKGDVFVLEGLSTPGTPAPTPAPGQLVRLDDSRWPDSARMLIVGEIESVSPSPEQLLRQVIVVRPLADVTRVSEVLLRIAGREEAPR